MYLMYSFKGEGLGVWDWGQGGLGEGERARGKNRGMKGGRRWGDGERGREGETKRWGEGGMKARERGSEEGAMRDRLSRISKKAN
jgi:hypothetical protein